MYGFKKNIAAVVAAVAVVAAGALPAFGQAPCSQTDRLSATATGVQSWNGTKSATTVGGSGDDAYGVEAWTEAGGDKTKLTWYGPNQGGGFAFRAEWTNSTDYLGRFGYFWGNNGKKWNALGDLCVDYNYTRSANGTGGTYSYLGVYGWTIGNNTSAEYYIVEDWFGANQQTASNLGSNCQTHGNITVDGKTYQVVTCIRPQGSGCVSCGTENGQSKAFGQVFSIRQGMRNPEPAKCGTISIKKHFEEWTKMTTEKSGQSPAKYIFDHTYESKFLAEAQGGTGWFEATYMKFSRTGACGITVPPGNHTLSLFVSPTSAGTVTYTPKKDHYGPTEKVTITATPADAKWAFSGWDGAPGTTSPVTVTMNEDKTITARFVPVTDPAANLVTNGTFTNTDSWKFNQGSDYGSSAGTFSAANNKATLNITALGKNPWEPQLVQNGITLVQGVKYRVTFDASAGAARTMGLIIQMAGDPYTTYFEKDISLTNQTQTFTYEFTMEEANDENGRIGFNLGQATGTVTISNVSIKYATTTGIAADRRVTPASSAKPTLRATPNSSGVKVSFKSSETGAATLRLYSLKGDVLSAANLQTVSGKSYTHTLTTGGKLPSGLYMVGLQRNGSAAVERMAVLVP